MILRYLVKKSMRYLVNKSDKNALMIVNDLR